MMNQGEIVQHQVVNEIVVRPKLKHITALVIIIIYLVSLHYVVV
jgi:hypothetical protein